MNFFGCRPIHTRVCPCRGKTPSVHRQPANVQCSTLAVCSTDDACPSHEKLVLATSSFQARASNTFDDAWLTVALTARKNAQPSLNARLFTQFYSLLDYTSYQILGASCSKNTSFSRQAVPKVHMTMLSHRTAASDVAQMISEHGCGCKGTTVCLFLVPVTFNGWNGWNGWNG